MSKLQSLSEGDDLCEEEINAEEGKRDAKYRMGCDTAGPCGESDIWTKWEGEEGGSGMASRGTANVWLPDEVA